MIISLIIHEADHLFIFYIRNVDFVLSELTVHFLSLYLTLKTFFEATCILEIKIYQLTLYMWSFFMFILYRNQEYL